MKYVRLIFGKKKWNKAPMLFDVVYLRIKVIAVDSLRCLNGGFMHKSN